jgi:hypothetical protein
MVGHTVEAADIESGRGASPTPSAEANVYEILKHNLSLINRTPALLSLV